MSTPPTRRPAVDDATARARILAAASDLFYARGIQSVGMDALSKESGIGLKRVYQLFPSKEAIVEQVLASKHEEWTSGIEAAVAADDDPRARLLSIFDFLGDWFTDDGFRGCVFINSFGELGANPQIAAIVREHKEQFQEYVSGLVERAGAPDYLAPQLSLLAEGAQTTAAIAGSRTPAEHARRAAETLIDAALLGAAAR